MSPVRFGLVRFKSIRSESSRCIRFDVFDSIRLDVFDEIRCTRLDPIPRARLDPIQSDPCVMGAPAPLQPRAKTNFPFWGPGSNFWQFLTVFGGRDASQRLWGPSRKNYDQLSAQTARRRPILSHFGGFWLILADFG